MNESPSQKKTISLQGKRCIVTGGSRGTGRAICVAFAKAGAKIAFTYSRSDDYAEDARNEIINAGFDPLIFKGSVSDASHVKSATDEIVKTWGGVDVLVNNAGINQMYPLPLLEEEDWDRVMDINLKGAYLFSRQVLKNMIRAKKGHILNIGSFASERFIDSPLHYAASKSGLRGFTESLALEVGKHNILVNLLSPGLLDIGMSTILPKHRIQDYLDLSSMKRLCSADEIAETAAFLVSDENSFMTGAKIVMDGGI